MSCYICRLYSYSPLSTPTHFCMKRVAQPTLFDSMISEEK